MLEQYSRVYCGKANKTYFYGVDLIKMVSGAFARVEGYWSYDGAPTDKVPDNITRLVIASDYNEHGGASLHRCKEDCDGLDVQLQGLCLSSPDGISTLGGVLACCFCNYCDVYDFCDLITEEEEEYYLQMVGA